MTRVLVITGGEIGPRMAGPAIRASAMASTLSRHGRDVVLATTSVLDPQSAPTTVRTIKLKPGDDRAFRRLERSADVIVFQGHAMEQFRGLAKTDRIVVADAYDPMHLEMLEQGREQPREVWDELVKSRVALMNQQLARADLVLCASDRQRSFYLGSLAAVGRISPATYSDDPHLDRLLAVVPFGLSDPPPAATGPAMRNVMTGIDAGSKIILWGGGIYPWFDPGTLIHAVHTLWRRRPATRLVFLGTKHPDAEPMGAVKQAIDLAQRIGALGVSVHFNDDWVPYDERGSFFAEANAGVSTHHAHIETEFSFRTRILDYMWAGLPMAVTEGDSFADVVDKEQLGAVVPAGDVEALATALERVLYDTDFAAAARVRVTEVRERYLWDNVLQPLTDFVLAPTRAADIEGKGGRARRGKGAQDVVRQPLPPGLRRDMHMAWHYLRHGGVGEVRRRIGVRRARR